MKHYYVKHSNSKIDFDTIETLEPPRVFHTHYSWYREPTGNGQWFGGAAEVDRSNRLYADLLGWEESKEGYDCWMDYAIDNTEEH